jgi:tRNA dimethylallyltransferase
VPRRPPLVVIAGPTASGKSALALELAHARNGVVINADSAQVYRDLRVVTARPTAEEEATAPHALFGHIDAADPDYSAARWAEEARSAIAAATSAGRLPILVGGTGLYVRTLLDGIAPVPPIDPAVRGQVRAMPVAQAHAALSREDPAAAARLAPADTARVARALEVVRSTGRPLAHWQAHREGGIAATVDLRPALLLPDRDALAARIDARLVAMFADGAVEEVRALLARPTCPPPPRSAAPSACRRSPPCSRVNFRARRRWLGRSSTPVATPSANIPGFVINRRPTGPALCKAALTILRCSGLTSIFITRTGGAAAPSSPSEASWQSKAERTSWFRP